MFGDMVDPVWMLQPMPAEVYDALPPSECKGIEIVDGMIRPHPSIYPLQKDVAWDIARAIEAAGAPHWMALGGLDLRLGNEPLHNRTPDVMVFSADVDLHQATRA